MNYYKDSGLMLCEGCLNYLASVGVVHDCMDYRQDWANYTEERLVSHYWGWQWPWWLVIATGWGLLSVVAMRSMIKAGLRVEQRVNDIVDGGIRRWVPNAPENK